MIHMIHVESARLCLGLAGMPPLSQIIDFLRIPDLSEKDAALIRALPWEVGHVKKSGKILAAGETPDFAFMILAGWAARYDVRRDGTRRVTGFLLPGDVCWIHAVTATKMDHSVSAITACDYTRVSASALREAINSSAKVNMAFLRSKLIEEAILRKWLRNSLDAKRSLAHFICELHARSLAIGHAEGNTLEIPLTQDQIGDALSLTAVHTNRMFRSLRESGLVNAKGGKIIIMDLDAVHRFCGFNPLYLHQAS